MNSKCKICNSKLVEINDFGEMPLANNFITESNFKNEYSFKLKTGFCNECKMFQLVEQPDKSMMFNENYAFKTRTSKFMVDHFQKMADKICKKFLRSDESSVLEIGCNDGVMLERLLEKGIKVYGVEPSKNVSDFSNKIGINCMNNFFSYKLSNQIKEKYGGMDVIYSANVLCHIPNILEIFRGIENLLNDNGVLIFEDPYLGEIIKKNSFDQIYDEHVFFFSVNSVKKILEKVNLSLFDVEPIWTHGGSMRYYISKNKKIKSSATLKKFSSFEEKIKLTSCETYFQFKKECEMIKDNLFKALSELKEKKLSVVGYGATSKSATTINYCNIADFIDFIVDTTPSKINKFTPKSHIPIRSHHDFEKYNHKYSILFAWNHMKEIFKKEKKYMQSGGKWITYFPKVKIF